MSRFSAILLAGVTAFALVGCSAKDADVSVATEEVEAPALNNALGLSAEEAEAIANNGVLFWTHEQKVDGFAHMEDQFPVHVVERGDHVAPLPDAAQKLEVTFEVDGAAWTLDDYMERNNTAGLLVIKDGEIVVEKYGLGHSAEGRWTSFSVAKSFSSTMVGAAIKDGLIESVDDQIVDYLPGLKGSAYEGVRIRDVLNMTSGVMWNESYEDPNSDVALFSAEPSINGSDPVVTYMAKLPREATPGRKWVYKTGETNLVGSLVRRATGKSLAEYLSEKVWKPYGMEQDAVWMLDLGAGEIAGCCLSASLRDYGRFGQFFMKGAMIDGESIVPDDWIKEATSSTDAAHFGLNGQGGYGFQWWLTEGKAYRGSGIFGQGLWINPELDLVVVTQSAWDGATESAAAQARQLMIDAIEATYTR